MTTTAPGPARIGSAAGAGPGGRRPDRAVRSVLASALATAGVGATMIVGLDGRWYWCLARVLVVGAVTIGLLTLLLRRGRPAAGAAAGAVGLVATSAGGAIAIPYGVHRGGAVRTIGGDLAVGGGLLLLVLGTALLFGALRRRHWVWAVPAWFVLAYTVGSPLALAVAATNVPRAASGTRSPADLGLAHEDVTLRTSDDVRLAAWYVPSANGAAIVALPGASSTRAAVLDQAAVLARHGYGVLLVDPRGMGASGGRAMNLGWYGDVDVSAAVDFLQQRAGVDPTRIGALGESMGGEEALGAMAADPRLRAVVAEGASNRSAADVTWLGERYGWRGRLQLLVDRVRTRLTDLLTAAHEPTSLQRAVVAGAPRPVLLIAAGTVADERYASEHLQRSSPSNVTVWVAEGAGHTGGLRARPTEWADHVTRFFDSALPAAS